MRGRTAGWSGTAEVRVWATLAPRTSTFRIKVARCWVVVFALLFGLATFTAKISFADPRTITTRRGRTSSTTALCFAAAAFTSFSSAVGARAPHVLVGTVVSLLALPALKRITNAFLLPDGCEGRLAHAPCPFCLRLVLSFVSPGTCEHNSRGRYKTYQDGPCPDGYSTPCPL